jgi:hypothetical protein
MAGSLEARRTPGDPSLLSVARLALLTGGEADRDDKCEIGIGDIWRRRWKRRGAHNHGKRLSIEKGRSGRFLNPTADDVALSIESERETDHALASATLRWVSFEACQVRDQRLLPLCNSRWARRTYWRTLGCRPRYSRFIGWRCLILRDALPPRRLEPLGKAAPV